MASCGLCLFELPLAYVGKVAGNSGCGRHRWAYQVRAPTPALTPLKVAVGGGSAALSWLKNVRIHSQTHRATRFTPVKAGVTEDAIESLRFGCTLHLLRSRHHHGAHAGVNAVSAYEFGGR